MSRFTTPDNATRPGIALAHTLGGEPTLQNAVNQAGHGENVQQATGYSTAPYKNPREGRCIGAEDTCGAYPMAGSEYCVGHARSLGLIQNWNKKGKVESEPA